jgi:hypothetical protein
METYKINLNISLKMKNIILLILILLGIYSCNSSGDEQLQNSSSEEQLQYDFSYGCFARNDNSYEFIKTVYRLTDKSLEIITYNSKRDVKNPHTSVSLTWVESNNGLKVGYNENEKFSIVFYKNKFYFNNGSYASSLISDLKQYNNFDNSLFLEQMNYANNKMGTEANKGLYKLTDEELNKFNNSNLASREEVVKEIIDDINK